MKSIVIDMKQKKSDLEFLNYYNRNEHMHTIALFINALGNTRNQLGKTEEDFYNFDLLSDTMGELWDEIETIENEME